MVDWTVDTINKWVTVIDKARAITGRSLIRFPWVVARVVGYGWLDVINRALVVIGWLFDKVSLTGCIFSKKKRKIGFSTLRINEYQAPEG